MFKTRLFSPEIDETDKFNMHWSLDLNKYYNSIPVIFIQQNDYYMDVLYFLLLHFYDYV